MHDDVVDQRAVQHDQAPVEANHAVRSAASPALELVTHQDRWWRAVSEPAPPSFDGFRQPLGGAGTVPGDDGVADRFEPFLVGECGGNGDR